MLPDEIQQLPTKHIGQQVWRYACLESTNALSVQLAADNRNDGLVVLADVQTAGRGQHGRDWQCPPCEGVLLSVILFPPPEIRRPVVLASWAAVAVCETIGECTGLPAVIKWPNDVLIHGRKVCGILIEQSQATIAGIGLNVNQTESSFVASGLPQAGSLSMFLQQRLEIRVVFETLISNLDKRYQHCLSGASADIEQLWIKYSGLLEQFVRVECNDRDWYGRMWNMSWQRIDLEIAGRIHSLVPESIKHINVVRASAVATDGSS